MGDFFMEDNYLIQSKIHTKAIALTMTMMVKKCHAEIQNYHDLFFHWFEWLHLNAPFYENLNYPSRGEHLEVTLAKLRASLPTYTAYAKSLLNDLETIITIYESNEEFFSSLYRNQEALQMMMIEHVNEEESKFDSENEDIDIRTKIDSELEFVLCAYRHDRKLRAKLQELEDKYFITIDLDKPQCWFDESQDMYEEHRKRYKEFLNYKGNCLTSVRANYAECAYLTAENIYNVLSKELKDNETSYIPFRENKAETPSATKVYLNGDICKSFYRSGAVELFIANCSEEQFYQLMNKNFPEAESGVKLIYTDGLYYALRTLKYFLTDKDQEEWITGILAHFKKNYKNYEGHCNDVFADSENEKSIAFKLYPIVKNWLESRKKA